MAFYQLPKIIGKDNKPPFGARINWHHPLSQGLVGAWLLNEGGGGKVFDSINNMTGTLTSSNTWQNVIDNNALKIPNGDNVSPSVPHNSIQNPGSMTLFTRLAKVGTGQDIISKGSNLGYRLLFWDGADPSRPMFMDRAMENFAIATNSYPNNTVLSISSSADANGISLYVNGKLEGSSGTAYGGNTTTGDLLFGVTTNNFNGYTYCVYLYNRRLISAEHAALAANPYQMFLPVVWDAYYVPAAAPPVTGGRSIFGYDSIFHAGGIIQT